ncbi:hypothetical protein FQN50_006260 [Emmonsiellopsis sp. PD_5]|nr:hypothetical protein FQN50_006260 [Emmonsiellopsis sp. PD_5]
MLPLPGPPPYPDFMVTSHQRAGELHKEHPFDREKIPASFFENLRHCYLHPPDHQRHLRPSVIFVAEIVKPETFHSFLQLPRELRDIIYYYALRRPTDAELRIKPGRCHWDPPGAAEDEMPIVSLKAPDVDLWAGREEMSRLLRVNRQIHDEASEVLYSAFTFTLQYVDIHCWRHNLSPTLVRRVRRLAMTVVSLHWRRGLLSDFEECCMSILDMFAAMQSFEFRVLETCLQLDRFGESHKDQIIGQLTAIADRLTDRGIQVSFTCPHDSPTDDSFGQEVCRHVEAHVRKHDGSVGQLSIPTYDDLHGD